MITIIDVVCIVLPSGETFWIEASLFNENYKPETIIKKWHAIHPEYDNTPCTMGIVEIKMPKIKYDKIQTNNSFPWESVTGS
jgi:hypothetical protein